MKAPPDHRCRIVGSPWPGVYGTVIESGRHYGRHWHATHGVGLLVAGAQRSASGQGKVDAMAGDVITHNPGEVHDGRPLGGDTRQWRMLYWPDGSIQSMAGEAATTDLEFSQLVFRDAALSNALRQLFARLDSRDSAANSPGDEDLACEEAMAEVCGSLMHRHAARSPARPSTAAHDLGRVRDRLADDLLDAPTLDELARLAGLSRFQLLRRFSAAYGVPPHAWLLQCRAEKARGLIQRGTSLAVAADAAGFSDQSHMTRVFARQFGFTPGAWQRAAGRRGLQ